MERTIRALVAVEGLDSFDVQRALPDDPSFQLLGMTDGVDETVRTLQTRDVDVLLVACQGSEEDRSLQIIDNAHRTSPARADHRALDRLAERVPPAGVRGRRHGHGALPAVEGAAPLRDEQGDRAPPVGADANGHRGEAKLICVLGPKGGTGKTLTACNLAVALALANQKVLVIDLDLQFGDVALCLGLPPEKTMYDLALSGGSLDEDKLRDYVMTHDTGVDVLLAPARPDQASAITIEMLRDVLVVARAHYDFVIADTPPGFTAEVISTIDASSDLVMVGTLDSLSLKNTKLGLETLQLMDYDESKIQLVLNRADTRVGISHHDVVTVLGMEPNIFIPSDREIPRAVNEGVPVTLSRPQSYAAASFHELAALFTGGAPTGEPVAAAPSSGRRGLFRLRRK